MSGSKKTIFISVVLVLGTILAVYLFFNYNGYSFKSEIVEEVKETTELKPTYRNLGFSVEGRAIESYTFGQGEKNILLIGGLHGGYEWNTVLLAYKFIDYFTANQNNIPKDLSVTIIPSANPDGLFKVTGKEGRFTVADVSTDQSVLESGRFNANEVDLNRNFDCKWKPTSTWRSKIVKAGTKAFSEPEAKILRDFIQKTKPEAVVFWHSQASTVYSSECESGPLAKTLEIANTYAGSSGYNKQLSFDSYEISGDSGDWLASVGIPAITVELKNHNDIDWQENLAGVTEVIKLFTNY